MGGSESRATCCLPDGAESELDPNRPVRADDFIIERVVGRGAYGVVVLVRARSPNLPHMGSEASVASQASRPSAPGAQPVVRYAMKMQNTEARSRKTPLTDVLPSRAISANREKEIMKNLNHPFIIHLAYFFELPGDREWKDVSTGKMVSDSNGNRVFHEAIVMEFVGGGDLETYIFEHSPAAGGASSRRQQAERANLALQGRSVAAPTTQEAAMPAQAEQVLADGRLSEDAADWFERIRRWSAEMCVGLTYLHSKQIIYRDLKPPNILLKPGKGGDLHICFTDFGFSKQLGVPTAASMSDRLSSLAGSPLYAAPEVMRIAQIKHREEYTPSVDLYSLGRTILVCFNRTRNSDSPQDLKMPTPEQYMADPRVPEPARQFIQRLTSINPTHRGTADMLTTVSLFNEMQVASVSGRHLPAIDWEKLENV